MHNSGVRTGEQAGGHGVRGHDSGGVWDARDGERERREGGDLIMKCWGVKKKYERVVYLL